MPTPSLILMGEVVGVHGIKGWVKIRPFCNNIQDFVFYAPFDDGQGRSLDLKVQAFKNSLILASFPHCLDRNQAEQLVGLKLYTRREILPEPEDENHFYIHDLIGLQVKDQNLGLIGQVTEVVNFGASDILVLHGVFPHEIMIPFVSDFVLGVDFDQNLIEVTYPSSFIQGDKT